MGRMERIKLAPLMPSGDAPAAVKAVKFVYLAFTFVNLGSNR